jgi:hypothetical protein
MITVYLVIMLVLPDREPFKLEDSIQPDLSICWSRAAEAVEKASRIGGEFEFIAQCSVRRDEGSPA